MLCCVALPHIHIRTQSSTVILTSRKWSRTLNLASSLSIVWVRLTRHRALLPIAGDLQGFRSCPVCARPCASGLCPAWAVADQLLGQHVRAARPPRGTSGGLWIQGDRHLESPREGRQFSPWGAPTEAGVERGWENASARSTTSVSGRGFQCWCPAGPLGTVSGPICQLYPASSPNRPKRCCPTVPPQVRRFTLTGDRVT